MAPVALGAQPAVMLVVLSVTADTGGRSGCLFFHRYLVAVVATERRMRAVQDEFRAHIVIEVPEFPAARVVA